MTIKHVWHQSEIREVESEYGDHILLKSLRPASIVIANQAESFSLSPAELFYHAIHSLDRIKETADKPERLDYCKLLCQDIKSYINERIEATETDMNKASCLVALSVGQCLYGIDRNTYHEEILALFAAAKDANEDVCLIIMNNLNRIANENHNERIKLWLSDYIVSDSFISDDIEDKIMSLRERNEYVVCPSSRKYTNDQSLKNLIFKPRLFDTQERLKELKSVIYRAIRFEENEGADSSKNEYTINLSIKNRWYYFMQALVEAEVVRRKLTVPQLYEQMKEWFPEVAELKSHDTEEDFLNKLSRSVSAEKSKWKQTGTMKLVSLIDLVTKNQSIHVIEHELAQDLYKAAYSGLCKKLNEMVNK